MLSKAVQKAWGSHDREEEEGERGWGYLANKVVSVGGVDLGLVDKVLGVGKVTQGA